MQEIKKQIFIHHPVQNSVHSFDKEGQNKAIQDVEEMMGSPEINKAVEGSEEIENPEVNKGLEEKVRIPEIKDNNVRKLYEWLIDFAKSASHSV